MEAGLHDAQYPEVVPLRTRASAAGGLNPSRRCPDKTAGAPQNSLIRFAAMELQPQRSAPLEAFIRSATGHIEPRWLIPDRPLLEPTTPTAPNKVPPAHFLAGAATP